MTTSDMLVTLRRNKYPSESQVMVADGGYLSWVYGTRDHPEGAWRTARPLLTRHAKTILALDFAGAKWREDVMPGYKQRRRDNRDTNQHLADNKRLVDGFVTEHWLDDDGLEMVTIPGLEADDIVALTAAWFDEAIPVIGIDKDFLQLPDLQVYKHNGYRMTLADFARRLPGRIGHLVQKPSDVLVCLVLLGDKSDSVPRILPKGSRWLDWMASIMLEPDPLRIAAAKLGQTAVANNVYVTILPCPYVLKPQPDPIEVLDLVISGEWWERVSEVGKWNPKVLRPMSVAIQSAAGG